jgi:deoxycytidine triphosphate deaminase
MTNINVLPLQLYVWMKIGQYAFEVLEGKVDNPYDSRNESKYLHQITPEESRIKWDN